MTFLKFCAASAVAMGIWMSSAHAAPILDQSTLGGTNSGGTPALFNGGFTFQSAIQNVTAGLSGVLTRVDLAVAKFTGFGPFGTGTLTVKNSANAVVATSNFSVASLSEFSNFNVLSLDLTSQGFAVTSGDTFKLELSHNSSGWLMWQMISSGYTGGTSFTQNHGGTHSQGSDDFKFATYVDSSLSSNVPTPGALALLGLGLLGIGAVRRRKAA